MSSRRSCPLSLLQYLFSASIIFCLFAVALRSDGVSSAADPEGAVAAVEVDQTVKPAGPENGASDPLPEPESSLTELQKALDFARESKTPEQAIAGTRAILNLLAEQQSGRGSMSAERQAQMREAVVAAQDLAENASAEDTSWKSEFREELKKAQECLNQAVERNQEAQQFADAVILGLMALVILFVFFLIVPELGCLLIVLIILGVLALLIF